MSWNRHLYPQFTCEGPLGFPMTDESARRLEGLLRCQPSGSEWQYQRGFAADAAFEFVAGERADVSVITSAAVDRDFEVVLPEGVALEQFRKNPVVTFAHRYDILPVGRALWIKLVEQAIKAKTRYASRPAAWPGEWLPDAVWHMVQAGDLRGKSIGFLPLDGHPPTAEEIRTRPDLARVRWIYTRSLLLEYAVAPVQSNPEALVEAVAKGMISTEVCRRLGLPAADIGPAGRGEDGSVPANPNRRPESNRTSASRQAERSRDQSDSEGARRSRTHLARFHDERALVTLADFKNWIRVRAESLLRDVDIDQLVIDRLDRHRGRV
jgi:hypothetical protein